MPEVTSYLFLDGSRFACFFRSILSIFSLVSSRRASEAIHLAAFESSLRISLAVSIAFSRSLRFRFPICRSAQFTAFYTKFLSSLAPFWRRDRKRVKTSSLACLSCTARQAISTYPARFTYSSSRLVHSTALR